MRKQTVTKTTLLIAIMSTLLAATPAKTAYAGTKLFGIDFAADYLNIKQRVLELKNLFSFKSPLNTVYRGVDNTTATPRPTTPSSLVKLTYTQKQINDLIKSGLVGRSLENNITLKSGGVEFLDQNKIKVNAELTNSMKAVATLTVIENGTALKVDSLDIENAGLGAKLLKPLVVKYLESQQKTLIKKYIPIGFSYIEVQKGLVNVYMQKGL